MILSLTIWSLTDELKDAMVIMIAEINVLMAVTIAQQILMVMSRKVYQGQTLLLKICGKSAFGR